MSKKKTKALPPVGSVIVHQLPNRLYMTSRVLRAKTIDGPRYVLAACSPYISELCPADITEEMKLILKTTYPGRMGKKPSIYWISSPLDPKSRVIGSAAPSSDEKVAETSNFGHWLNLQQDALKQWCWEHNRDKLQALNAEEAKEKGARRKSADALQSTHDAEMKLMTLKKLTTYKFFPDWHDFPPPKVIRASRQILKEHVRQLLSLGDSATRSKKTTILKSCVEAFNSLNDKHDDFVDTDIREDIIVELGRLGRASGLGEMAKKIDIWRRW
jgi:hypothetical protein